jgi:hypothetical protein
LARSSRSTARKFLALSALCSQIEGAASSTPAGAPTIIPSAWPASNPFAAANFSFPTTRIQSPHPKASRRSATSWRRAIPASTVISLTPSTSDAMRKNSIDYYWMRRAPSGHRRGVPRCNIVLLLMSQMGRTRPCASMRFTRADLNASIADVAETPNAPADDRRRSPGLCRAPRCEVGSIIAEAGQPLRDERRDANGALRMASMNRVGDVFRSGVHSAASSVSNSDSRSSRMLTLALIPAFRFRLRPGGSDSWYPVIIPFPLH